MQQPLVTVVTVTYNSARYVRDTIESVLAQTYPHIEYIIADDCSADDTWNIIGQYRDTRIRAYRNDKNLGEYPNRNKAIEKATGKYLIFIDGDDIIFSHGIAFFVNMMEAFPEAGMAIQKGYFNNILFPALFQPEEALRNHFYGRTDLLSSSFASNFFKTSLLKQWKLPTGYITGDDAIRLIFACHYPVLFVSGWVSWPRETPGQASSKARNGVGLAETYLYSNQILAHHGEHLEPAFVRDIENSLKRTLARFIVHMLRKAKWGPVKTILSKTNLSWRELARFYGYRSQYTDVLAAFRPEAPFRRGFLTTPISNDSHHEIRGEESGKDLHPPSH